MNKKSIQTKIHIFLDNYGKHLFYIPLFVIGIPVSLKIIFSFGKIASLAGAVLGVFWGFIIAHLAAPSIGNWFGNLFYAPKEYLKTAPDILSPVKGMITQEKYDEAIEQLNEILEEKPFSPDPYLILVEIYANELGNYLRAMELIEAYFSEKKVYAFDENIEMLLLYADICAEHNYLNKAQRLLEQEVARKGYSAEKRKRLQIRLDAIKERLA